eukprot:6013736-Heterocapsa_arctica.AAC.1
MATERSGGEVGGPSLTTCGAWRAARGAWRASRGAWRGSATLAHYDIICGAECAHRSRNGECANAQRTHRSGTGECAHAQSAACP